MKKFIVKGMTCSACSARVEKAVKGVEKVENCSVNLLTNTLSFDGDADIKEIEKAVKDAGYILVLTDKIKDKNAEKETNKEIKRLVVSALLCIIIMYFAMGEMYGIPMISYFKGEFLAKGIVEAILAFGVLVINKRFFVSGFKGFKNGAPNMDSLVSIGSLASFVYSLYVIITVAKGGKGEHLYFESSAMILTLVTLGKMLEARAKGKTANAIKALENLAPDKAIVKRDGKEIEVSAEKILLTDIVIVKPGMRIPCDGTVIKGSGAVDESALTGESIPVDKESGDRVLSATVNLSGYMEISPLKVGSDTSFSQIIKAVIDSSGTKAHVQRTADKISSVFVPIVLTVSLITWCFWSFSGMGMEFAILRAVSVLVISCPCALGLATPVAVMVGSGVGARRGILFKNASALEETGKIKVAVFDKTGTLTKGKPEVTDIITKDGLDKIEFLRLAGAVEIKSEHPLAKAVVSKCRDENIHLPETEEFQTFSGLGVKGILKGKEILGGNEKFINKFAKIDDKLKESAHILASKGKTPMLFAENGETVGIIAVSDTVREDSKKTIQELKKMGIKTVMLTGDNENTAKAVADAVGVDIFKASCLPEDKEKEIKALMKNNKVLMAGDGINDAPALTRANIGVAMGHGTDIASMSSDIVLVREGISGVADSIKLSRKVLKNIYENLFWALIYNIFCIPLAMGVFIKPFGFSLSPVVASVAMSASSICVVSNALRLNNYGKNNKKEKFNMEKIFEVEGMMCQHCSGRVKTALENIDGVTNAEVSHESGLAKVTLSKELPDKVLTDVIEYQGYKVK